MTSYAHTDNSSFAYKAGDVLCVDGHSPLFSHFNEEHQLEHTPLDGGVSSFLVIPLLGNLRSIEENKVV